MVDKIKAGDLVYSYYYNNRDNKKYKVVRYVVTGVSKKNIYIDNLRDPYNLQQFKQKGLSDFGWDRIYTLQAIKEEIIEKEGIKFKYCSSEVNLNRLKKYGVVFKEDDIMEKMEKIAEKHQQLEDASWKLSRCITFKKSKDSTTDVEKIMKVKTFDLIVESINLLYRLGISGKDIDIYCNKLDEQLQPSNKKEIIVYK